MARIKTIVAPSDFSEASQCAIDYAAELAEICGASLHLIHVDNDVIRRDPATADEYRQVYDTEAERKLQESLSADLAEKLDLHCVVLTGTAFVEIVRYAKEVDANMIVMATHGRSALVHMLLGSVAENVIRTAPCPVLSIRDPDQEFSMP